MSGGRREHHGRSTQRARRGVGPALAVLALVTASAVAFAKCELKKGAEIPVTMRGLRPLVPVKFNGQEGLLLVDSGAFFSTMTRANAQELGLKQGPPPIELRVTGAGGDSSEVSMTTVKELTLGGQTLHRVDFLVGGSEMESGTVGILGQNILGIADTEYDFANGVIRLFRTEDCRRQPLAYWAQNEAVEEVDIESIREARLHTIGAASVNGVKIRVMFDTGAGISMLTLRAAQRAGIKLDAPGVTPSDEAYGFGKARFKTWVAPVSSFALGGEEIKNTKLRIGDMPDFVDADMLIGPDFFLSHRVYVSNEQHKLYFTYNGGPVFNLKTGPQSTDTRAAAEPGDDTSQTATGAAVAATPVAPPAAPAAPPDAASAAATPGNAAELSRLGMAFAARHDYEHALEDLERACALAPNEPEYRYQRAFIHMQRQEGEAALSDLDAVLSMKPDHLAALMARAQMHLGRGDREAARADLDAAALAAPKPSEYRYQLAELYTRARLLPYIPRIRGDISA